MISLLPFVDRNLNTEPRDTCVELRGNGLQAFVPLLIQNQYL